MLPLVELDGLGADRLGLIVATGRQQDLRKPDQEGRPEVEHVVRDQRDRLAGEPLGLPVVAAPQKDTGPGRTSQRLRRHALGRRLIGRKRRRPSGFVGGSPPGEQERQLRCALRGFVAVSDHEGDLECRPKRTLGSLRVLGQDLHPRRAEPDERARPGEADALPEHMLGVRDQVARPLEVAEHGLEVTHGGEHPDVLYASGVDELLTGLEARRDGRGAGQEREDDPPRRAQQLAEVPGPVGVHQAAAGGLLQLADAAGTQVDRRQNVVGLGHPHLVALVAEGFQGGLGFLPDHLQADRIGAGDQAEPGLFQADPAGEAVVTTDCIQQLREGGLRLLGPPHDRVCLGEPAQHLGPLVVACGQQRLGA